MRLSIALFVLLLLPALAPAQGKATLQFPVAGRYDVWTASSFPERAPQGVIEVEAKSHTLDAKGAPADWVFVWDRQTGNVAAKQLKEIKGTWILKLEDFKFVGSTSVRVEHKGEAVATAGITLNDGKRSQRMIIDETAKGLAEFFVVAVGEPEIEVEYLVDGKPKKLKQSFELASARDQAQPEFTVSIAEGVKTVASTGTEDTDKAADAKAKGKKPIAEGNPWTKVVMFLIALAVVAALFYFGLQWFRGNPEKAAQTLTSMGVQVPGSTAPSQPADPAQAVVPATPAKPQQILLDDAAPAPAAGMPVAAPASVGSDAPRIVRDTGDTFEIPEGTTTIGREVGMGLSLLNESTVSRNHAELIRNGSQIVVRDLGSTNGTFVNGAKLVGEQSLRPGDAVQFGSVKFRFEV